MNEQQGTAQTSETVVKERCLCRELVDHVQEVFGVPPEVREHFTNSRIEFLKGIRAVIDSRIERLSKGASHGTKIAVE